MIYIYICYNKVKNKVQNFLYQKMAMFTLKRANAIYNDDIKLSGKIYLNVQGKISIGKSFVCNSHLDGVIDYGQSKIIVARNAELKIGDNSGISNVLIHCYDNIKIGNYVNIGAGTMIFDTNFHSTNWEDRTNREIDVKNAQKAPISIGDYVFIGARCIIGKGVTIGDKSIIAAGSVVICNVPSGELWGGNPARFIKKIENSNLG